MAKKTKSASTGDKGKYEIQRRLRSAEGQLAYHLYVFGDSLAKREGYVEHDGVDALHYYLIHKHHWLPSQTRSLSWDDLLFIFAEEMSGWTAPKDAR
jgi:hypothetical protein